jgi:hypothetical protein
MARSPSMQPTIRPSSLYLSVDQKDIAFWHNISANHARRKDRLERGLVTLQEQLTRRTNQIQESNFRRLDNERISNGDAIQRAENSLQPVHSEQWHKNYTLNGAALVGSMFG